MDLLSFFSPGNSALGVICGVVAVFLGIEIYRFRSHTKVLEKIPIRIHVNGSRGKSSVTRLIGAAMRKTQYVTVTKTTGTAPRFIMPDGVEIPVFRPGKPNIIEQLRLVAEARNLGADALVIECMAVTPEYIAILEDKIIRSTIGIITNIREDHLDVMGPTMYDVTVNIAKSLPRNSVAFTAEKKWFPLLEEESRKRGTLLSSVDAQDVSDREMAGFSYLEHKENVAVALKVVSQFGMGRGEALEAMYRAQPDPGVLRESTIPAGKGRMHFFNALAANDPESSLLIWNMACALRTGKRIAIFIMRSDRIQRTESFALLAGSALKADAYVIAGSSVAHVAASLQKKGVGPERIFALNDPKPEAVIATLMEIAGEESVAVAMGNIVGLGEGIAKGLELLCGNGTEATR